MIRLYLLVLFVFSYVIGNAQKTGCDTIDLSPIFMNNDLDSIYEIIIKVDSADFPLKKFYFVAKADKSEFNKIIGIQIKYNKDNMYLSIDKTNTYNQLLFCLNIGEVQYIREWKWLLGHYYEYLFSIDSKVYTKKIRILVANESYTIH